MTESGYKSNPLISVVSPVYGCIECLPELGHRLKVILGKITPDFEIILVDDGSPDQPWDLIQTLGSGDSRVKGVRLSRNFGQHNAIAAGLEYASGEWIVVMDCDLQDQPEEIQRLYQESQKGYDIVLGRRLKRKDRFLKKIVSNLFYKLLSYLTNTKQDSAIANFGIYHRKVIQAIHSMGDSLRYFPAMVQWAGFKQTSIDVEHTRRSHGKTSYTFKKLMNLSMDVILAFSEKPLRMTVKLGLSISLLAFLFALFNLFRYLRGEIQVTGWTSLIISIWFLSGIIILLIGIAGLYIGKIFESVKNRPKFIVSQTSNITNKQDV